MDGNGQDVVKMDPSLSPERYCGMSKPNLSVKIGSMDMQNPVTVASGTFGYGPEYTELVDLNKLGAITVKGIAPDTHLGNPTPRTYETRRYAKCNRFTRSWCSKGYRYIYSISIQFISRLLLLIYGVRRLKNMEKW